MDALTKSGTDWLSHLTQWLAATRGGLLIPGRAFAFWIYLITLAPVLLLLAGVWYQPYVPIGELMRDSLLVAEVSEDCCHIYYGAVSNIGVLLWAAGAAILFFTALVMLLAGGSDQRHLVFQFILGGVLTTLLCVDDFFLVHDVVLPKLGFSETVAYVVYAVIALIYVIYARNEILAARWPMFLISIFCLALSVKIDVFMNYDNDFRLLIEDGAKLIGIAAWLSFHAETAACVIARLSQSSNMHKQST